MRTGVKVTRIASRAGRRPSWSLAVFAHNESGRIGAALAKHRPGRGRHRRRSLGSRQRLHRRDERRGPRLRGGASGSLAGRNRRRRQSQRVERLRPRARSRRSELERSRPISSWTATSRSSATRSPCWPRRWTSVPSAKAAGGMPATGRDRDSWRARMVRNGTLAGNLYALACQFRRRRARQKDPGADGPRRLKIRWCRGSWRPQFGRTSTVGSKVLTAFLRRTPSSRSGRCRLLRPADYPHYLRRKWRYTRGGLQLEMLVNVLRARGLAAMPAHVHELYANGPLPSRLRWVGLDTPLRLLAVLWIRSFRNRP